MLDNPNQLDIFQAIDAGNSAMTACVNKAQRIDPEFKTIAEKAILSHLQAHGEASGESLTDVAKQNGAKAHDDRAFGSIYQGMAKRGLIRIVGYCKRTRGHGAPGPVWGIVR